MPSSRVSIEKCCILALGLSLASAVHASPPSKCDGSKQNPICLEGEDGEIGDLSDGPQVVTPAAVDAAEVDVAPGGAEEVIEINLTDEEKANLQVSVDAVKELLEACKALDGSLA